MLNFTSVTIGLLTSCLFAPSLKAIAAIPNTSKSDRTLYAQGVFDFNNGERRLSVGQSPSNSIDGPNPKPYVNFGIFNRLGQSYSQFEQKAEEQKQLNYFYLNRWPKTPKEEK